ncbi:MAG: membrane integrity-associated transporter subunit PqiC [Magnetococcales bacterium]|nr:membrane integrity-associated transporter subunit PqiC [Magnetococcales bacterium]MBF0321675.1 membrane integrity-associated transporter subunit PqiC [Magnetococcales bacterium]
MKKIASVTPIRCRVVNSYKKLSGFSFLALFVVSACTSLPGGSGGQAALRHYLLTPSVAEGSHVDAIPAPGYALELLQVALPPYLNRSQIVTRLGPNELHISEAHQWGDTLAENITRTTAINLSRLLGHDRVFPQSPRLLLPANLRLATEINRFEQDADGHVVLDLVWRLFVVGEAVPALERRASWTSEPVAATDYALVVAAMSRLLGDFSASVAQEVTKLRRP